MGFIENGGQDLQIYPLVLLIPVEILEDDLPPPQILDGARRNEGSAPFRSVGDDHLLGVTSVQQHDPVVLVGRLEMAQPLPNLIFSLPVLRLFEIAPHQARKRSVFVEYGGIPQPLLPEACEFADLKLGDGAQLALHLDAEIPFVVPVVIGTADDDPRGQEPEDQDKDVPGFTPGLIMSDHERPPQRRDSASRSSHRSMDRFWKRQWRPIFLEGIFPSRASL